VENRSRRPWAGLRIGAFAPRGVGRGGEGPYRPPAWASGYSGSLSNLDTMRVVRESLEKSSSRTGRFTDGVTGYEVGIGTGIPAQQTEST
jgi:hypothetical protein